MHESEDMAMSSGVYNPESMLSAPSSGSRRTPRSTSSTSKQRHSKQGGEIKEQDALSMKGQVLQLLAIAAVAGLVATSGFISVEWIKRQLKPFCDSGIETIDADRCIVCPPHGLCMGGRLECSAGFIRVGKSCVPDEQIDRTAHKLAASIKNHVCRVAAGALCDGATGSVGITEGEVLKILRNEGLEEHLELDEKFYLVWEKTAGLAKESIVIEETSQGKREFHCPPELAEGYKSIRCLLKEFFWEHFITLFFMSPVIVFIGSLISKSFHRKKTNARAEELYLQVCGALEEKALESKEVAGGESWVVVSRLRDHLLLPNERKRISLWKQVEGLVQEDSRIDQYQKKVKGEMKIVWEWQVEGAVRTPGSRSKGYQRTSRATTSSHQQVNSNAISEN